MEPKEAMEAKEAKEAMEAPPGWIPEKAGIMRDDSAS